MKNIKNSSAPSKKVIIFAIALAVLAIIYIAFAKTNSYWPFSEARNTGMNDRTNDLSDKDPEGDGSELAQENPGNDKPDQTVEPPQITEPAQNASFPVENAHYKIERAGSNNYTATLYAILNSPAQYDEYQAQLKQYKGEVTTYLSERFGNINNLTIKWIPSDAENI